MAPTLVWLEANNPLWLGLGRIFSLICCQRCWGMGDGICLPLPSKVCVTGWWGWRLRTEEKLQVFDSAFSTEVLDLTV